MREKKPGREGSGGANSPDERAVEIPIDGELDLHFFSPRDVEEIVSSYLSECLSRGILQVRIVHGKGTGILRARVHAVLKKLSMVASFGLAGENAGGWGATIVRLKPEE
ncbi:MAG: Smr/MutS family protein [Spirochaetes bacterium]|nr:Smr/MutS family protein [Spirochaetota bacterium]